MSSRTAAAPRRAANHRKKTPARRSPVLLLVIGLIVALFAIAIAMTRSEQSDTTAGVEQTREISLSGDALPAFEGAETDPAIGRSAPEITGSNFEGDAVAITNDGRNKIVLFLAHWCPYCQEEVPSIAPWLEGGGLPATVDMYSVSTGVDQNQPNYPPSDWLTSEEWSLPVLADDGSSAAGAGYGLTSFPYWVFVDEEGKVASRFSGLLSPEQLNGYLDRLDWR